MPILCFLGYSTSNNGVPVKSWLGVTHPGNLCIICVSLNSTFHVYAADGMGWVNFHSLLHSEPRKRYIRCVMVVIQRPSK